MFGIVFDGKFKGLEGGGYGVRECKKSCDMPYFKNASKMNLKMASPKMSLGWGGDWHAVNVDLNV